MPAAAMTMEKPAISFVKKKQTPKRMAAGEDNRSSNNTCDWLDTPEGAKYLKSIFDKDEQKLGEIKFYSMDEADSMMRAHIAETHKKFGLD